MTVYGIQIDADCSLPLRLPERGEALASVSLRRVVDSLSRKSHRLLRHNLYTLHGRRISLRSAKGPGIPPDPGDLLEIHIDGVIRFSWCHGTARIEYRFEAAEDNELLAFWLLHLIIPFYLSLERRAVIFHGSALRIDGRTLLLVAPYQAGKSTLTDRLLQRGHTLVTDDILATYTEPSGRIFCVGSHPYRQPHKRQESLGVYTENYFGDPQTIERICFLEKWETDEIDIRPVSGVEKFMTLQKHGLIFSAASLSRLHQQHLMKLVAQTPAYRLRRPWDLSRLDAVAEALERHLRSET